MRRSLLSTLLPLVLLCGLAPAAPVLAQVSPGPADLGDLDFRELGPAVMGGRVADLDVDPTNPAHWYVGFATGGLWETKNHGATWTPLFDEQATPSIGDVTIAPGNPKVIWVGTGEPQNRNSSPYGNGVYRSIDGGKSWTHLGLEETQTIAKIAVHPRDPDVAYVAATGHLWGPNPERGVYRTTDGGESWEQVLYVDEDTGAIDLVMDPNDPNTLFAAMYQRRRTAFGFSAWGPGSGLYRTLDGGESWVELTEGLPEGHKGRIGIDVWEGDGDLVYASVEGENSDARGLYRSTDRGDSWEKVSDNNPRPMYFSMVRIDPSNPDRIYLGGVILQVSDDGGRTWWEQDGYWDIHVDNHAMWIDPNDSNHLVLGHDGGIASSWDAAESWVHHDNLAVGQFYEIGVDMRDPYWVCGGLQDNSSWCGPSNSLDVYGPDNGDWYDVWGGDGFYNEIDPTDWRRVYTGSQNGNVGRVNAETGESQRIRPACEPLTEDDECDFDFNWNTPIVVSQHDPATVYIGSQKVLRTRDRGLSWEEASGDLTREIDRDTLEIFGRPLSESHLSRNDGIGSYGNITTISESPVDPEVLWAGTDDGNVQVTRDGGATWTNVVENVPGLPGRRYVSRIEASHQEAGRGYLAFDGHHDDDLTPYLFVTEDFGASWSRITDGLPDHSINVVREHPRTPELLFVGNEVGIFTSFDRGASWHALEGDLPVVPVDDLVIHPRDNDLVVGTHGRSIWILDDVGFLERIAERGTDRAATLFPVERSTIWSESGGWPFLGEEFYGENPPDGAILRYHLTGELDQESVALVITNAAGDTIRTLDGPVGEGLHTVVWGFDHDPAWERETGEEGGFGGAPPGPQALPGMYTVHLDVEGETSSESFELRLDPRVETTPEALAERFAVMVDAHRLVLPAREMDQAIGRLEDRLEEVAELLEGLEDSPAELRERVDSLQARLGRIEDDFEVVDDGVSAGFSVRGDYGLPTARTLWELDRGWEMAAPVTRAINEMIEVEIPALYRELNDRGIRADPGEPLAVPTRGPGG